MTAYRDPVEAPLRKLSVDLIKTYKHINEVRDSFVRSCWSDKYITGRCRRKIVWVFPNEFFFSFSFRNETMHQEKENVERITEQRWYLLIDLPFSYLWIPTADIRLQRRSI